MKLTFASIAAAAVIITGALAHGAHAKPKGPSYTDPKVAAEKDPQFKLQGEYAGALLVDGQEVPAGVQVIALGDGKFRMVAYLGGLPGAGWGKGLDKLKREAKPDARSAKKGDDTSTPPSEAKADAPAKKGTHIDGLNPALTREKPTRDQKDSAEGSMDKDGVVTFKGRDWSATIKDGKLTVTNEGDDKPVAVMGKVERKSPTLGEKPIEGAQVLFDGKSADKWVGRGGATGDKLIQDGLLVCGVTSKPKYQSFYMHIEFRLPYEPMSRGQGRGNSGLYLQQRYEVQMLDSFGLEGADNECGGIYKVASPIVNMCYPPLTWQTYDVIFHAAQFKDGKKTSNARITVWHNGVLIHDDQKIPNKTGGGKGESPNPGPIHLQDHRNPVFYRNIWIKEIK